MSASAGFVYYDRYLNSGYEIPSKRMESAQNIMSQMGESKNNIFGASDSFLFNLYNMAYEVQSQESSILQSNFFSLSGMDSNEYTNVINDLYQLSQQSSNLDQIQSNFYEGFQSILNNGIMEQIQQQCFGIELQGQDCSQYVYSQIQEIFEQYKVQYLTQVEAFLSSYSSSGLLYQFFKDNNIISDYDFNKIVSIQISRSGKTNYQDIAQEVMNKLHTNDLSKVSSIVGKNVGSIQIRVNLNTTEGSFNLQEYINNFLSNIQIVTDLQNVINFDMDFNIGNEIEDEADNTGLEKYLIQTLHGAIGDNPSYTENIKYMIAELVVNKSLQKIGDNISFIGNGGLTLYNDGSKLIPFSVCMLNLIQSIENSIASNGNLYNLAISSININSEEILWPTPQSYQEAIADEYTDELEGAENPYGIISNRLWNQQGQEATSSVSISVNNGSLSSIFNSLLNQITF